MPQPAPSRSIAAIAVQLGLISKEQLQSAQAAQAKSPGKTLNQVLVEQGFMTIEQIRSLAQETSRHQAPATVQPPPSRAAAAKPVVHRQPTAPHEVQLAPVAPRRSETRRMWILSGAIGAVPVLGILAFFLVRSNPESSAPPLTPPNAIGSQLSGPDYKKLHPPPPKEVDKPKPVEEERIRVKLQRIPRAVAFAAKWNDAVDRINSSRDPEQYRSVLPDLERCVHESRGTDDHDLVRDGYRAVVDAIKRRGEQVFNFLQEESKRLGAAGKYGDAVKSWDWFPGTLDLTGAHTRKIDELRQNTLASAKTYFSGKIAESESLVNQGKLPEAEDILLRLQEIGLAELADEAYKHREKLTLLVDAARKKADEEELARFEEATKARGEATKLVTVYQGQFWDLVSRRNFEGARDFLAKQRPSAPGDVPKAIDEMLAVLEEIRRSFDLVADRLKGQAGRTVSLAFLENGEKKTRSFLLKAVRDGNLVYDVGGREVTASVADLHSSEIAKVAGVGPEGDRSYLEGVAKLLEGGFDEAHLHLTSAGPRAAGLVKFVENSSAFLERNVPIVKKRAEAYMEAKEWEKAAQEYSKLATLPAERKEALQRRARAYYQGNNFVGAVVDIETLFGMDDFSAPTIELLNQTYQRSGLIARSIQIYETANRRVPENVQVLTNLVKLYMKIHEYQKAKEALARAEKLQGGSQELAQLVHLLGEQLEPSFPGQVFKTQIGRYDVETNVSAEYANQMGRIMDTVYRDYAKVFPYKKNESLRFHLKLFSTSGEFRSYFRRVNRYDPAGVIAYYLGITKELVGWKEENLEEMTSTLRHEGLHQFIDYFVADCPIWFNEGYASYFESSTADEVKFNPGRHPGAKVLLDRGELPHLRDLCMMSDAVFRAKGGWHYSSSWSAIYYFIKSGRKAVLDRYLEALMEGKDQQQAFDAIFGRGKLDVDEMDAKWRRAVFSGNYDE